MPISKYLPLLASGGGSSSSSTIDDYLATILADSPWGMWRLNETTGIVAADSSGNANDGVYLNSPTLGATGPIFHGVNTAVTFNGTNQSVDLPSINATVNFSVEAWIKTTVTTERPIWSNRTGAGGVDFSLAGTGSSNQVMVYLDNFPAQFVQSTRAVNDNTWHHVVWTSNGTTSLLYIDGTLDATATGAARTAENHQAWIGYDDSNLAFFSGSIDEVVVYQSTLTAARVLAHYNAAPSGQGSWVLKRRRRR